MDFFFCRVEVIIIRRKAFPRTIIVGLMPKFYRKVRWRIRSSFVFAVFLNTLCKFSNWVGNEIAKDVFLATDGESMDYILGKI